MRNLTKLFCISVILFSFAVSTYGQVVASASSSATIVTPIAITKTTDLDFGSLAVNAVGGTLTIATDNFLTPGSADIVVMGGTATAAAFDVSGTASVTFSIELPSSAITLTNGIDNITVDNFVSNPTVAAGGTLDAGGDATVLVGARLNVPGGSSEGSYTNAAGLTVTVNYN